MTTPLCFQSCRGRPVAMGARDKQCDSQMIRLCGDVTHSTENKVGQSQTALEGIEGFNTVTKVIR